jgi:hypothetical protein
MLTIDFYIGVAKYAFCAFTAACLVAFLYSFVEQMFPNVLLSRSTVSYRGPQRKLGIPLVIVGLIGLAASLVIFTSGSALSGTVAHLAIAAASAVIFDIGAMMYLMSEVKQDRAVSQP